MRKHQNKTINRQFFIMAIWFAHINLAINFRPMHKISVRLIHTDKLNYRRSVQATKNKTTKFLGAIQKTNFAYKTSNLGCIKIARQKSHKTRVQRRREFQPKNQIFTECVYVKSHQKWELEILSGIVNASNVRLVLMIRWHMKIGGVKIDLLTRFKPVMVEKQKKDCLAVMCFEINFLKPSLLSLFSPCIAKRADKGRGSSLCACICVHVFQVEKESPLAQQKIRGDVAGRQKKWLPFVEDCCLVGGVLPRHASSNGSPPQSSSFHGREHFMSWSCGHTSMLFFARLDVFLAFRPWFSSLNDGAKLPIM